MLKVASRFDVQQQCGDMQCVLVLWCCGMYAGSSVSYSVSYIVSYSQHLLAVDSILYTGCCAAV
jgi:hypothetical protein